MSSPVIHVENLGKRYKIGERERYLALRDVLAHAASAPLRLFRGRNHVSSNGDPTHIWALKDVSFDVHQGEVVGIIGRNGAGKTTLLKLLARVAKPTEGFADVRGRMGSLLEVGTGFHPELTGRENTFLSGAILGMSKAEILRKFDEIVSFAEVEKFIDTPLKYYSTGMQTRLAFAVAAHLEPEILLVDEVLSVGDIKFQKKCLGKMGDVAKAGRTILFVSHQMNQIRRLCPKVIWIDGGSVHQIGAADHVLAAYDEAMTSDETNAGRANAGANKGFLSWEVLSPRGAQPNSVAEGLNPVEIRVRFAAALEIRHGLATALIYDNNGHLLVGWAFAGIDLDAGTHDFTLQLPVLPLRPGAYDFFIKLTDDRTYEQWNLMPPLIIEGRPVTHFMDEWSGSLNIPCQFSTVPAETASGRESFADAANLED